MPATVSPAAYRYLRERAGPGRLIAQETIQGPELERYLVGVTAYTRGLPAPVAASNGAPARKTRVR